MFRLCPPFYTILACFTSIRNLQPISVKSISTLILICRQFCCLLASTFDPGDGGGFILLKSRWTTSLHSGASQKFSQITLRIPQIQVDVFQCFSTKTVYEFRVFLVLLTSSAYEDSRFLCPDKIHIRGINAKRNGVHPVLCFSFVLQNVLGWNVFSIYYDNSPLLRIMYTSLPQTVFWRQNMAV
jgi:hypothetical protein